MTAKYDYVKAIEGACFAGEHGEDRVRKVLRKLARDAVRLSRHSQGVLFASNASDKERADRIARELVPGPSQKRGRK